MNKVILIGHLGGDAESCGKADKVVAKVNLATNTAPYTNPDSGEKSTPITVWHTIFFYNQQAETALKHFKKGQRLAIVGELRTNKYTDKNGNEASGYFVKGKEFEFVGGSGEKHERSENGASTSNIEEKVTTKSTTTTSAPSNQTAVKKENATEKTKKNKLEATVTTTPAMVTHTEADLSNYDDTDPTAEDDDLPF